MMDKSAVPGEGAGESSGGGGGSGLHFYVNIFQTLFG